MKNSALLNIIKWLIVASLFTPLIVSGHFIFPYVFPKTAVFQILVEIMFFLWLILIMGRPEYRPKKNRLFWAIVLFLAAVFIASLFGVNFSHSFWSNYERMTGIITLFHYFAFFLILSSVLKTKKDWFLVFDAFIAVSIILSLFALGQKLNLKDFLLAGQPRLSATFGNPAYFAAYLLFVLFFIVFMFFQRRSYGAKIYYIAVFIFDFLIMYWTETRGALLGFGAALILFSLAMIFWPKEKKEDQTANQAVEKRLMAFRARMKKIALVILILFVVFMAALILSKNSSWVQNSGPLKRLTTISLTETTSQTRLLAWKMSWRGFLERPVFGWGWENYNVVFNKFYDPHLFPVENWFDRAHNIVFDTLVTTGLVGFLSYLLIFGAAFLILWRAFKQKKIDFLNAALFAILLMAYFAQDLFIFDMLYSYVPFFLVLAFIAWVGKDEKKSEAVQAKPIQPNVFSWILLVAIFIGAIYFVNLKPALASYYGVRGVSTGSEIAFLNQQVKFKPDQAQNYLSEIRWAYHNLLADFKKALSYGTFGRFEVRLQLFEKAKEEISNYQNAPDKNVVKQFVDFALEEGDKTLKELPLDVRYQLSIGQLNLLASQFDPGRLDKAVAILEAAYQASPTKQIIIFALAQARVNQGRNQEAISLLKKAVELNDQAFDSQWNLALIYFATGDNDNGLKELAQIEQKFGRLKADQNKKISDIFAQQGNYPEAISYLLKAIDQAPLNADFYAALAGLYFQSGDKQKAKEAAQKAGQLNPEMQSAVEQFIKSLGT